MIKMRVWYWDTEFARSALLGKTPTKEEFQKHYNLVLMRDPEELFTKEEIFALLNNIPRGNKLFMQVVETVKEKHYSHTSMSVGDIIEIKGRFFLCYCVGWEDITNKVRRTGDQ